MKSNYLRNQNDCFRIALVQLMPQIGNTVYNADRILRFLDEAAEQNADLVMFPECSLSGYSTEQAKEIALDQNDLQISRIRKASREMGISVCYGYIEKKEGGLYLVQELAADSEYMLYRKTHLGIKEKKVFQEGNDFPVCHAPVCIGIQLCWESHIPEISIMERNQGAELLLVPYASPMSKERCRENWNIHLPARASDNGVYLAACNLLFPGRNNPGETRGGGLAVFDPKGRLLTEYYGTEEKMILSELRGPLPRECADDDMHNISYFDRKRTELFCIR